MSGAFLLAGTIALRGATLIDGTGAPPLRNSLLVISGGRIVSVTAATPEAVEALPAGTRIVSAGGKWIVPGWIDAHVHAETDEDLKTMLRWGVTSARLMAEDTSAARRLARTSGTRTDIPEVFPAAPIFTAKGGWWDQGEPADPNVNRFPATPEQARVSVRRAGELGSAEIKLMLDDMAWCRAPKPPLPKLAPAVATALIGQARAEGLRATVHAPTLDDAKAAIAAGATALAHGVVDPMDDATIAVMKARPVFYIPTMDIFEFLADTRAFVDGVFSDPAAERGLPAATVVRYRSDAYTDGYREKFPNFESLRRRLPVLRENLRKLHAAGVPVALGTDMWAFPGLGVSIEMDLYVKAGLTPLEAIRSATQTAARSLGIDPDRGTIEAGKRADFLILDGDPVRDIRNVRSIDAVYKRGEALRIGFP
ncbi:MAG: amidohydrolase family protein [Acidobacteriota bacterium]|nr:amidohydrolase family protein [Acidobacteriota bacterium]